MGTNFLRELVRRCRIAARSCSDIKTQQELREIGDELSKRANLKVRERPRLVINNDRRDTQKQRAAR
jgi:hypothetical protein